MISDKFIIISSLVYLFYGNFSYLLDTIKGKVKPNKVTWFLWGLIPLIAFFAEINQGVKMQSLMTFMVGFGPFLVFLASFVNKTSQWKVTKFDIICGSVSIFGLILWQITKVGNIAILLSIFADAMAGIPTIVKSYKAPDTENYKPYLFAMINSIVTLLSIKTWNFAHWGFPLYIFLLAGLLTILMKFRIGEKVKKRLINFKL